MNLAGGRGGRNLQRQKGGILSVIIYRELPPALLRNNYIDFKVTLDSRNTVFYSVSRMVDSRRRVRKRNYRDYFSRIPSLFLKHVSTESSNKNSCFLLHI